MVRHELKYFLSAQEAWVIRRRLVHAVPRDPYSREGGYFIRSLYFDNAADTSFFDRTEGFENRKKYRLRLYEFNSKEIKLEIKLKLNEMIDKDSVWIPASWTSRLVSRDYDCLLESGEPALRRIYYEFKRDLFNPVVVVDYRRDAFALSYNNIRITFDTALRKSSETSGFLDPHLATLPVLEKYHTILEIKYNGFFPAWLAGLLSLRRFERRAQSKYCFARMV